MLRPGRKTSPSPGNGNGIAKPNSNGNGGGGLPLYHSSNGNGHGASNNVAGFPSRRRYSKSILRSPSSRRRICCNKYMFVFAASLLVGGFLFSLRGETISTAANAGTLPQGSTYAAPPLMTWDHDPSSSSKTSKVASFFQRRRASVEAYDTANNNNNNRMILPPHPPQNGVYDVVVLGAGPAGLTAALFAARAGLSVLVTGSDAGALSETFQLENFPAYSGSNNNGGGPEWLQATKRQAAQWGASFAQAGLLVDQLQIDKSKKKSDGETTTSPPMFTLEIASSSSNQQKMAAVARSVVVATGATSRRLDIQLEDALWGKSVHSCAVCDGSSYVDKTVVVVGGGDAAVDGALLLARYAKKVILVHRRTEFRASNQRNLDLLKEDVSKKNILEIKTPYIVKQFETTQQLNQQQQAHHVLTGIQIQNVDTQEIEQIVCDGVFELIGATPNTEWIKSSSEELKLDEEGFLTLAPPTWDSTRATTVDGIFAAGEVTDNIYRQAITAAAEGAQAAMDAERWLRAHPAAPDALTNAANKPDEIPLQKVLVSGSSGEVPRPSGKGGHHPPHQQEERVLDEQEEATKEDCNFWEEECINKHINSYPVVMFSKERCPECKKALEIFTIEGLPVGHRNLHIVDITTSGTTKSNKAREVLLAMTGSKSVPSIFINGKSIGGHDELVKFHRDGKLKGLLTEAGATDVEDCDLEQQYCIEKIVNKYPVVIFSKPWCPYCRKALEALSIEGLPEGHINLHVIDLSTLGNKAKKIQNTLNTMTGRRTVPNVFIGGTSIGGGDETVQLAREGKLSALLNKAKALGEGMNKEEVAEAINKEEMEESEAAVNQHDAANEPDGGGPCDLSQEPCLKKVAKDYPVVVFTKTGCPHCTKALEALALDGLPEGSPSLHIVNLNDWSEKDMDIIQDILERWTDRRTVPNVFIGGTSIGGGSETVQMQESGALKKLLEKVNAIEPSQLQAQQQRQQGLEGQEQKLSEDKQQQQQQQQQQFQGEPQERANQQQQAQQQQAHAEQQQQAKQQQAQEKQVHAEQQEQARQQQAQQQEVQAEPQERAQQQQAQQQQAQLGQQEQAQQQQVQQGQQEQQANEQRLHIQAEQQEQANKQQQNQEAAQEQRREADQQVDVAKDEKAFEEMGNEEI